MYDFSNLNDAQLEAVTWEGGPLLVLAGPGSGKTYTIVQRISYLLKKGVPPEQILVITFTKEAAASMQHRFQKISQGFSPVNFGTFHSVFYHILKESHFIQAKKLLHQNEKIGLMLSVLRRNREKTAENPSFIDSKREDAVMLLSAISYYKNTLQKDETLSKVPLHLQENFQNLYREYEKTAEMAGGMDYDDILIRCKILLCQNHSIREKWQRRFRYILIDEFQDINPIQYEIIKLLAPPPNPVFAVGDDDQSIYGFRGSNPECLKRFETEYSAKRICLSVNYRSGQKIIDTSLAVMEEGKNRYLKKLKSGWENKAESIVTIRGFAGKEQEQNYLLEQLKNLQAKTTAVLFRTNTAMQSFAVLLHRSNLPYQMKEKSISIYEHFIIKDVMAYLLLASGQENQENFLRIMNKPCRFISREKTLEDKSASKGILQLKRQLECMKDFTPALAVNYVLKAVGYERYLRQLSAGQPEKWQEWENILEWLKQDACNYSTVRDWQEAQWLYQEKAQEDRKPEKVERQSRSDFYVQLMTVHAAKGLEFDVVYIPDCNEGVFPYKRMPDTESVEEERRVLYVAMTRAKENLELLYLTGTEKSPRLPSRFLNPLIHSSSSMSSSNSQLSKYSSKASETFSNSSLSSIKSSTGSSFGSSGFSL